MTEHAQSGRAERGQFTRYVTGASAVMLVSRVTGYIREMTMARMFGTSSATDAWLMASVLPNLLFASIYGQVPDVVTPMLLRVPPESRRHLFAEIASVTMGIALLALLVAFGTLGPVVKLLAPGFSQDKLRLTVQMTAIMLPTFLLWTYTGLLVAVLQTHNKYVSPAWAMVGQNLIRITSILTLEKVGSP